MARRSVAPMILIALMLMMSWGTLIDDVKETESENMIDLETEDVVFSASDPGHVVFSQYITSDNCGYCYQYGSPAHNKLKTDYPDRYVYISYQSQSYGDTDTTRAGNTANYNWPWTASGAPDSYWGDRLDKRASGCGSNTCYDSMFSSGGGMSAATTSQYSMGAGVSASGSNLIITVTSQYVGSTTPPTNIYLYAALTEETCNSYPYSNGYKGHNCWKSWLTSGGTYKSQSSGSGSSFESVSLGGGNQVSFSWTVPASLVNGGVNNAMVVAALMTGSPSTGASNEHTLSAIDSSMNPMDLSISTFTYTNLDAQSSGFQTGDILKLDATVENSGTADYSDGGQLQFFEITSTGNENAIGSPVQLNSLNIGQSQSISEQFDTSGIMMNAADPNTVFRVKLTGTQGEKDPVGNNQKVVNAAHDLAPSTNKPIATGFSSIFRGESIDFEVTGIPNDNVDDLTTMTAELEVSPYGTNQWESTWVSGGNLMGAGTAAERYVFTISTQITADIGDYDIRARLTDARGQVGDWSDVNSGAITLNNLLPIVITTDNVADAPDSCPAYPGQPQVKVETIEKIDVAGIICDAETPLNQLVISSNSPAFRSWDAASGEIEVRFDTVQQDTQGNVLSQPMQLTINDGESTNSGTLHVRVIENGAPRWSPIPTISFEEGSSDSKILTQYLSDTDAFGEDADINNLILSIHYISNTSLISADMSSTNSHRLMIESVDGDAFGNALVVVRATDLDGQFADVEVPVIVTNVNDAPTLDTTFFDNLMVKVNEEFTFDIISSMSDVDDSVDPLYASASCDTWKPGSRYNPLNGQIKAWFEEEGTHTISITVSDIHDAANSYYVTIEVVDNLPLIWSANTESGDLMAHVENLYITENPVFNVSHHSELGLTAIEITWQICNSDTGLCTDFGSFSTDNLNDAYSFTVEKDGGMLFHDQIKLSLIAVDSNGFDRETTSDAIFDITEERPKETVVDDSEDNSENDGDQVNSAASGNNFVVFGVVGALVIALLVALVLGLMLVRGGKGDNLGMGYGSAPPPGMPPMPLGMVPDYSQLPAGGNYVTNNSGQTVYLAPDNTDWTMQPDNSFLRTR